VTRKKISKFDLIRLVRTDDENVEVDLKGKSKGRGANLTPDLAVFDEAVKRSMIEKALKLKKKMGPEKVKILREQFIRAIEEKKFRPKNKPVRIRIKKQELEQVV
jgi:predicted RNA-binding protein YlxR (DUF448 family)